MKDAKELDEKGAPLLPARPKHRLFWVHVEGLVCASSEDDIRAALGTFAQKESGSTVYVFSVPGDGHEPHDDDGVAVMRGRRGAGCRYCKAGNIGGSVSDWRNEVGL